MFEKKYPILVTTFKHSGCGQNQVIAANPRKRKALASRSCHVRYQVAYSLLKYEERRTILLYLFSFFLSNSRPLITAPTILISSEVLIPYDLLQQEFLMVTKCSTLMRPHLQCGYFSRLTLTSCCTKFLFKHRCGNL